MGEANVEITRITPSTIPISPYFFTGLGFAVDKEGGQKAMAVQISTAVPRAISVLSDTDKWTLWSISIFTVSPPGWAPVEGAA